MPFYCVPVDFQCHVAKWSAWAPSRRGRVPRSDHDDPRRVAEVEKILARRDELRDKRDGEHHGRDLD